MKTRYPRTNAFRRVVALLLALGLLTTFLMPASAAPTWPYKPCGTVTSNGRLAPDATQVSAWIGGVQYGAAASTSGGWYSITIPGDDPETPEKEGGVNGDIVSFKVNGYAANETATFVSGGGGCGNPFNLTVTPTAVTLSSLSITRGYNRLFVRWQTADETGLLGFNLYRGTQPRAMEQGTAVKLNGRLIPGRSSAPGQGAAYGFIDRGLEPATSYYYWIESVMTSGARQVDGPVASVAPGADTCTDKGICPVVPGPGGQ